MPVFAVQYTYVDDPDLVTAHRPAHRDFLRDLLDNWGIVLAAGAYTDGPAVRCRFLLRERAGDQHPADVRPVPGTGSGAGLSDPGMGRGNGTLGRLNSTSISGIGEFRPHNAPRLAPTHSDIPPTNSDFSDSVTMLVNFLAPSKFTVSPAGTAAKQ